MFSNVSDKLKNFSTKTTGVLENAKSKLSFDNIEKINKPTRTCGLVDEKDKTTSNIIVVVNWIVTALGHVIERVEEQGDIITLHTKALADPKLAIVDPKEEEIDSLKKHVEKLTEENDETHQRGIKGNLIISGPDKGDKKSKAERRPVGDGTVGLEDDTAMVIRLIKLKTGVDVSEEDVVACHSMGKKKDGKTVVIRFTNRKPVSAWHTITEGKTKIA